MRGDGGVASEGRVVGVPKFHSWGKYTMPLTNINSDWMSNASSGLCIIYIILYYLYYLCGSFKLPTSWGVIITTTHHFYGQEGSCIVYSVMWKPEKSL